MMFVFRTVPLLMCCLLIQETKVTNSHGLEMNGILPVSFNKVFFFFLGTGPQNWQSLTLWKEKYQFQWVIGCDGSESLIVS